MNAFVQSLRNLGPMRLAAIGVVGAGVLAFFVYLMSQMATPPMAMLYGDLQLADANRIVRYLEDNKVSYELKAGGSEVWVPALEKDRLRVKMAERALPGAGSVGAGYELFDNNDVFGSTDFVQNVNLVRALEGELSRTIGSIEGVRSARVHLVLPRREMFSREEQKPSASIVLALQGGRQLGKQQVAAIQHLVAAAVPKLAPTRVSIVDDRGTLLARGTDCPDQLLANDAEELRRNYESRLARTIEELLGRSVGPGKVRAEVAVELNFDRIATTEEIFDPEGQVVRSSVTVEHTNASEDSDGETVTIADNLPQAEPLGGGLRSATNEARTEETVNYEISKTIRNHVKELGRVDRISVAVLVDGIHAENPDGTTTYQPRSPEQMDQLTDLVQSAIGYDPQRGDQVSVINMRFAEVEAAALPDDEPGFFGLDPALIETIASNLGLSVVAILFMLLVLKPLVSRAIEAVAQAGPAEDRRMIQSRGPAPVLAGPGAAVPTIADEEEDAGLDELIDIDKVEGRVKASSIRKIGEIIDKHPDEALSIIRNWMYQEG